MWRWIHTRSTARSSERGFSLAETALALALVALVLLAVLGHLSLNYRQLAHSEDLLEFQNLAAAALDAAAHRPFELLAGELTNWAARPRPGVSIAMWKETPDPDVLLVWVKVGWADGRRSGREVRSEVRLGRVFTRPSASLSMEVPL